MFNVTTFVACTRVCVCVCVLADMAKMAAYVFCWQVPEEGKAGDGGHCQIHLPVGPQGHERGGQEGAAENGCRGNSAWC